MKAKWETKQLGTVCDIGAGSPAPQNKEMFDQGQYPFFRTSDIGQIHLGNIKNSKDKLNEEGIKKLKLFSKGTLLFPKSGASTFLNHRVLMGVDGYVSSHLATLKANKGILEDRFLFYFSLNIDSRNLMQDQNYPSLRLSDIQEIPILVPSLSEQKQIVKILDKVFEDISKAKENAENNLKNAKELFKSYLKSVFNNPGEYWEEKKLSDVCDVNYGTRVVRKRDGGNKYHVYGGGGATFFMNEFNREDQMIIARFAMSERCVRFVYGKFFLNDSGLTVASKDKNEITQEFLDMQMLYLNNYIYSLARGTAQKNLDVPTFRDIELYFPTLLKEQKSIVSKLDSLSNEVKKLESIYNQKLSNLEELKKSILKKAFNGELTGIKNE